jgi:RimJ/RimL family protein N-acetyltransferase
MLYPFCKRTVSAGAHDPATGRSIAVSILEAVPSPPDRTNPASARSGRRHGRWPPQWIELTDGTRVAMQLATPEDDEARRAFYDDLSNDSRYQRFLQPVPRVTDALFRVIADPRHHAVIARDGEVVVADAVLVVDQRDPSSAEIAYAVSDDVRRQGLGRAVVDRLLDIGATVGVCRVHAVMSGENRASAALMRSFGAKLHFEDGLLVARMPLCPARAAA